MSQVERTETDDSPKLLPYSFRPTLGQCADADMQSVSRQQYGEQFSFYQAGALVVKHAP